MKSKVFAGIAIAVLVALAYVAFGQSSNDKMDISRESFVNDYGNYLAYSPESFKSMSDQRRVLFFHAQWCPTCKAAEQEFKKDFVKLPDDVYVFQTDYDTEIELKKKYEVTYQHTFVQVDSEGNEILKWGGSGIDQLLRKIK